MENFSVESCQRTKIRVVGGTKERGELHHEEGSRSGERMQESPSSSSSLFIILADKHALAFSAAARRPSHARCAGAFCAAFLLLLYDLAGYSLPPPAENGAHEKALATAAHSPAKPRPPPTPCFEAGPSKKSYHTKVWCVQQRGKVRWMGGEATRRWFPDDEP